MRSKKYEMRGICTRSIGVFFLVVSLLIINCSFSYAIRPLYTEDCWVTTYGKAAIESGWLFLTRRDNTGVNEFITSIKYGLTEKMDIGIDLPYMSVYSPAGNYDGMSTGTFKIKYNFYKNEPETEGGCFLLGYQVDTDNQQNFSEPNAHDVTTMLIYSNHLKDFSYHLNFGYQFDDEPGGQPREDSVLYNASLIKPLSDIINIMGEVQYSINTYTSDIVSETAIGFNYKYNKNLLLDMAIGCGLNENSSSSNLALGLTYLFD
jgi:hypothetical protein